MAQPATVDLVVATVDRTAELDALLHSLAAQEGLRARVLVVDQNDDDRVGEVLARHADLDAVHLARSERGLSGARNAALPSLTAELVAFPDDDCTYPPGLMARVVARFADHPELDGLLGRTADPTGRPAGRRFAAAAGRVDRTNVWTRGNSASLFVRRELVERVGGFDEALGVGAPSGLHGEEVDWLIRALDLGAELAYDPELVVHHASPARTREEERAAAARAGRTVGFLLRRHRYGLRTLARMAARPVGGAVTALARRDTTGARVQLTTLGGRIRGYRAGSFR